MSAGDLGIYEDTSQLDHDVDLRLGELISTMEANGVDRAAILAALRRSLRGQK